MKQTIRLNESQLRQIIREAAERILRGCNTPKRIVMESKQPIKITDGQLHGIIKEAVGKVLNESNGKKKLQNSFKSKEDMTRYRDKYRNGADISYYVGDDNAVYDSDSGYDDDDYSPWNTHTPYKNYAHHYFDDGYDYCGDDDYNKKVSRENANLKKRLATKGGQMSYDWEHRYDDAEDDNGDFMAPSDVKLPDYVDPKKLYDKRRAKQDEFQRDKDRYADTVRRKWINHEYSNKDLEDQADYIPDVIFPDGYRWR